MNADTSQQGALFVIDGTDGSGKATQTRLLVDALRADGLQVETIAFPQYDKPSASMLKAYLAGDYGAAEDVGPYRASIFFAIDRFDGAQTIRTWLQEGKIVIADRYVSANMGHQAANIVDPQERQAYLAWDEKLEYDIFELPRPDLTLILHIPAELSFELAKQGAQEKTKVDGDILEGSLDHLHRAAETYREIAERFPGFVSINCAEDGTMLTRETIHERIREKIDRALQERAHT